MKKMFKKGSVGFTMIELLIVIAVLGVLAVAVLAAINPIEQINRGRDTGTRSDAEQLLSAIDRYYTSKGWYPWVDDGNSTNTDISTLTEINSLTVQVGADVQELLTNLSAGGTAELKSSFVNRIVGTARHLWIYNTGVSGDSTYVCFLPQSQSFREAAWNRCRAQPGYGTLPADWPSAAPVLACPADGTCMTAQSAAEAIGCYSCLP